MTKSQSTLETRNHNRGRKHHPSTTYEPHLDPSLPPDLIITRPVIPAVPVSSRQYHHGCVVLIPPVKLAGTGPGPETWWVMLGMEVYLWLGWYMVWNAHDDPAALVSGIACKTMAIYLDWKNRALHQVYWAEQADWYWTKGRHWTLAVLLTGEHIRES